MKKKSLTRRILKGVGAVLCAVVLGVLVLLLVLTVTEYRPGETEELAVSGSYTKEVSVNDSITVMSWNIGYGALGDNADFFMDGGTHVNTATEERVRENLEGIAEQVEAVQPDLILLQEVDTDSKRSHHIDERQAAAERAKGYQSTYACNYRVLYVPYPLPTIGKVECGIMTLSSFQISESERVSLPCPFSYPLRLCNLKRCFSVNRIPVSGSDRELVLVNLHLEAYDSGEGKAAQTEMLREFLEKEAKTGNYVIAGGDFNQIFSNMDMERYPLVDEDMWMPGVIDVSEFGEGLSCLMYDGVPSCRSLDRPYAGADQESFQYYVIDGFIVSDNLVVNSCETLDLQFADSDHNPIVINVTLQ